MRLFGSTKGRVRPVPGRRMMDPAAQRKTPGRVGVERSDDDSGALLREIARFFPGIMERAREKLAAKAIEQPVAKSEPDSKSLRSQCFLCFELDERPAAVARWLKMKPTTAFRYYQSWKRCIPSFFLKHEAARHLRQGLSMPEKRTLATTLAAELNGLPDEVLLLLGQPWSTRQMVTGEWRQWPVRRVSRRQAWFMAVRARAMLQLYPQVQDLMVLATNQQYRYDPEEAWDNEESELLQNETTAADPE